MNIDKDPTSFSYLTYLWVFGLAILGGTVSFMQKVQSARTKYTHLGLVAEVLRSAFVGVITFLVCSYLGFSQLLTAALVGVSGHMGSKALIVFEDYFLHMMKFKIEGGK